MKTVPFHSISGRCSRSVLILTLTLALASFAAAQVATDALAPGSAASASPAPEADGATTQATGSGTAGRITRWTAPNALGNSVIVQKDGKIGIGTANPASKLSVNSAAPGAAAIRAVNSSSGDGILVSSVEGSGVVATGEFGVHATGRGKGGVGVRGVANGINAVGVSGNNPSGAGVIGTSMDGYGVLGRSNGDGGVVGTTSKPGGSGVYGQVNGSAGAGVHGLNPTGAGVLGNSTSGTGVQGNSKSGTGVYAESVSGTALYATQLGNGTAGFFSGNVNVSGILTKGGGSFKIDHPLEPDRKYLSHSFVESPDMMNIYNGEVRLDDKGEATVEMPDYFSALNREFRYQLTCIGAPGPNLYVAEEIAENRFKIAGGKPGLKVSWQVTGVRHDAYAEAHRIAVVTEKTGAEVGQYLHPELFGQPPTRSIAKLSAPAADENEGSAGTK